MTFGRRGRFIVSAVVAAVAGSSAAAAIPAFAGSTTTVSVLTIGGPGSSTIGVQTILPAPGSSTANWLVMSNDGALSIDQVDASGTVTPEPVSPVALHNNAPVTPGIGVGGADYLDDSANLLSLTPGSSGITSAAAAATSITARAMALGPDDRIYVTNNAGTVLGCSTAGSGCSTYDVPAAFGGGDPEPDAITTAGGEIWFTDDTGDLGSLSVNGTTGTFGGPYDLVGGTPSFTARSAGLTSADGLLWLIDRSGTSIDSVSPSSPTTLTVHSAASSTYADPDLSSLTTGPDGNVWFTDTGDNTVGFLDPTTGEVTQYPVPSGYFVYGNIGSGPAGTNTLVFPLKTESSGGGTLAVNMLGEITSPAAPAGATTGTTTTATTATSPKPATTVVTPGTTTVSLPLGPATTISTPTVAKLQLKLTATAAVSAKRVAAVKLRCVGAAAMTTCAGTLVLTTTVRATVHEKVRGKLKKVTVTKTLKLASGKYSLKAGTTETLALKLSAAEYKRLEASKGRELKVTATAKPTEGSALTESITLKGPKPVVKRVKK